MAGWEVLALLLMTALTRGRTWTNTQRFALTAGAFAVYVWFGFPTDLALHGHADLPAHMILVAVMVAIAVLAGSRRSALRNRSSKESLRKALNGNSSRADCCHGSVKGPMAARAAVEIRSRKALDPANSRKAVTAADSCGSPQPCSGSRSSPV